jgi:hypothetical protein
MPLQSKHIASDIFLPWAANLLPENEQLRTLGQLLGMARRDVIGLLSAIGGERLDEQLKELARRSPVCWRLMSVPGVGPIVALAFMAAIEDINQFRRMRSVGAYLRLTTRRTTCSCYPVNDVRSLRLPEPSQMAPRGGIAHSAGRTRRQARHSFNRKHDEDLIAAADRRTGL